MHLYAKAGFHQMKLIHQFLVQRPHVLRNELLMHRQTKLQYVSLEDKRCATVMPSNEVKLNI